MATNQLQADITLSLNELRAARQDGDCARIRTIQQRLDWLLDRLERTPAT
jgi:hypothetical protein